MALRFVDGCDWDSQQGGTIYGFYRVFEVANPEEAMPHTTLVWQPTEVHGNFTFSLTG